MYQGRSKSRDDPHALVSPKGFSLSPRAGSHSFAHNREQGRIGEGTGQAGRKRHTATSRAGKQGGETAPLTGTSFQYQRVGH